MTTTDVISPDLKTVLRRLKLSRMLDTLPERLTLARQQKMPHQDLLLQVPATKSPGARASPSPSASRRRAWIPRCAWRPGMRVPRSPWTARCSMSSRPCASSTRTPTSPLSARSASGRPSRARPGPCRLPARRHCPRRPHRSDAQDPQTRTARQQLRSRAPETRRRRPAHPRRLCHRRPRPADRRIIVCPTSWRASSGYNVAPINAGSRRTRTIGTHGGRSRAGAAARAGRRNADRRASPGREGLDDD